MTPSNSAASTHQRRAEGLSGERGCTIFGCSRVAGIARDPSPKDLAIEMLFLKRLDWKSFVRDLPDGNALELGGLV
jgi:hypothetical protein